MRRLAEGGSELSAEVGLGQPGRLCHVGNGERFGVARVGEIFAANEVARRRWRRHRPSIADEVGAE